MLVRRHPSAWTYTWTTTRDKRGRVVEFLTEYNTGSPISSFRLDSYRWDARGNIIEALESEWITGEPPTAIWETTFEYAAGRSGQP